MMTYWPDATRLGDHEWLFQERDHVLSVRDRAMMSVEMNVRRVMNRHAPFSRGLSMPMPDTGGAVIDSYYGYAYTGIPSEGSVVYGPTETLLPSALDSLADDTLGFLRVPFKRIPRIRARSLDDLQAVVRSASDYYGADRLLFRGQNEEYYLKRSPAFCQHFYGSSDVLEPSLTPSATRRQPSIEACMPEFMMWLQLWQQISLNSMGARYTGLKAAWFEQMRAEVEASWSEPKFYFQALALAQHYGLPSVGLDVSSDLPVALFFALRELSDIGDGKKQYRHVCPGLTPVIYILLREGTREYPFHDSVPFLLRFGRPAKQKAWFLHLGWGLARNAAADQIVAAVYLDSSFKYGLIPSASELFPSRQLDRLGGFLSSIGSSASEPFGAVLSSFYWIEDEVANG
jgi:hypothetical protein